MRPPAPQKPQTRGRLRVFFFCLLAFAAGFGAGAGWLSARAARLAQPVPGVSVSAPLGPSRTSADTPSAVPSLQRQEAADSEQKADDPTAPASSDLPRSPTVPSGTGRVALVVDDMGYDLAVARRLVGLGLPLTWAILPDAPHAAATAKIARLASGDGAGTPRGRPGKGAVSAPTDAATALIASPDCRRLNS